MIPALLLLLTQQLASKISQASPVPDAWLAQVSENLRREEYRFASVEPELWSAPNRAQELRSRVSRAGLEVFPRGTDASGEGATWKLGLGTRSVGRAGDSWSIDCRVVSVEGERAELDRGSLVEWFENTARGIEQGWTIAQRPGGVEALEIGLAIEGDLALRIDEGGRSGIFVDGRGEPRVGYRYLVAHDAAGCELEARLVPSPEGVVIQIDDARAVYPITVDPLLTNPAWTAESDQAGAGFGESVSAAGDVNGDGYSDVLVGASWYDNGESEEGRAYVYHGSASGLAASPAWTAESDQADARFGSSVSTAGDVNGDGYSDVIVGAFLHDNGESDEGRVFVYHGSASGLAASPAWTAESDQADARFGNSVSTAGDVDGDGYSDVIVGAEEYDNGESGEGRAFVYHGSGSGLAASPAWTAESDQGSGGFGSSVSTAGDVNGDGYSDVIVGAETYDNGETNEGRAFVYHGSASGLAASADWTAESNQAIAFFGSSVSTAGDVNGDGYSDVIIGAHLYDNGETSEGRAFVYHGSAGGLAASAAWTAEGDSLGAVFGASVSTAGDVNGDGYSDVIVGAYDYENGEISEGRALLYQGSASGLAASPIWAVESNQAGAQFGFSVATAGDVDGDGYSDVIVGANAYTNGEGGEGRAFLYQGSASGLGASEAAAVGGGGQTSVSTAGDVNGDGYSDVIVGASNYAAHGAAFLYLGTASGLAASPAWIAEPEANYSVEFGGSVASAGDVNGDGYSDVIVGSPRYGDEVGQLWEGRVFVYHGSASGLAASAAWTAESDQEDVRFGDSVSTAGDVNGDGYSDVIVGSPRDPDPSSPGGRAYLYLGSASGLAASPAWTMQGDHEAAWTGGSVSTAGDVNGDGYSDVIVGSPGHDGPLFQLYAGSAFVYHGSAGGLRASPAWRADGDEVNGQLGWSVSTAGDVNGDRYSDVIVGEYAVSVGSTGRAFVYHGSASGLAASPAWTAESNQAEAGFGVSVSTAGDVNGDGYSDAIVGELWYDNGQLNEGRAYLYHGSASGLAMNPAWTVESNQASAYLGTSVATAGDVNGDGYSDVIVAVPHDHAASLYLGNGGDGGLVRGLQQRNRNDTRPIALLGLTTQDGLFHLRAEFRKNLARFSWASPLSPTAWLEWELKPLGVAFDGTDIGSGTPQSLLPAGGNVSFDEPVIAALQRNRLHSSGIVFHWRARVATNNPLFPHSAWFSQPGNNITEAKLRSPGARLR